MGGFCLFGGHFNEFRTTVAAAVLGVKAISTGSWMQRIDRAPTAYANYNMTSRFRSSIPRAGMSLGGGNVSFHRARRVQPRPGGSPRQIRFHRLGARRYCQSRRRVLDNAGPVDPNWPLNCRLTRCTISRRSRCPRRLRTSKRWRRRRFKAGLRGAADRVYGSSLFGGKIHGYWTTLPSGDRRIQVICQRRKSTGRRFSPPSIRRSPG